MHISIHKSMNWLAFRSEVCHTVISGLTDTAISGPRHQVPNSRAHTYCISNIIAEVMVYLQKYLYVGNIFSQ